jgi:probable rRNA maturation factor
MSFVLTQSTSCSQSKADHSTDREEPPAAKKPVGRTVLSVELEETSSHPVHLKWLRARLVEALPLLKDPAKRPFQRIAILIVSDARMAELHKRHLGKKSTTDVLTFDSSDGAGIEADIAICSDVASREAARLGHDINRELLLYAIHGLLHCVGFRDDGRESFAAMHAEEDRILRRLGVGPTFAAGATLPRTTKRRRGQSG